MTTAPTMRADHRWNLGDRVAIATYSPPVALVTVLFGLTLGLALAAFLWHLGWTWAGGAVLVLVILAVGAACYLPLDHLAVGDGWVANGPPERPRAVETAEIRAITMPDMVNLGAPVIKLHTDARVIRVDVNALAERPELIAPVLTIVTRARLAGATIDLDADAVLDSLSARSRSQRPESG